MSSEHTRLLPERKKNVQLVMEQPKGLYHLLLQSVGGTDESVPRALTKQLSRTEGPV